jgi:hypothetical protein
VSKVSESEIIEDPVLMAVLKNAWELSMAHIGDGDELGQMANTVCTLVKTNYPNLFEKLEEE